MLDGNLEPITSVSLDGISINRGKTRVISDLSLKVPRGTVFGLIGPSGSGKTTLIRGLLGLSPVAGEHASILGLKPGSAALRPRIGYMPQESAIYPDLTAYENLEFFADVYRVDRSRVHTLLASLDLDGVAHRPVSTYSGGQQRRVALAAAMIPEPDLLLLDEPTVGLDPRLRYRLWDTFRTLASAGTTLIVSTHVMDEAEKCDQIAFLMEGRVVATGTPLELREQAGVQDLESAVLALTTPISNANAA